jgi:hypothetical protein
MNTLTPIPELDEALTEARLLERAVFDAIEQLLEATVRGRSPREAIKVLDAFSESIAKARRP